MDATEFDAAVTTRAAQPYVGTVMRVPMDRIVEVADAIPGVIERALSGGLTIAGPPFMRYLVIDMERELAIEAGVPVAGGEGGGAGDGAGAGVDVSTLPGGRFATTVHHGHPAGLIDTTAELLAWADEQGLTFDAHDTPDGEAWGCRLENYLTDPQVEPDMNQWDTELAFRLADGG